MLQQNRELGHIESIRAFAALSVALFHFINFTGTETFVENETIKSASVFGAQGVELFYVISGFIIPFALFKTDYALNNYFVYLAKRFIRLLPPYLATILAINLLNIILCKFVWYIEFDVNIKQILVNIFFLADLFPKIDWINPIFQTLKVEVQFYILIGLLFPLIIKNKFYLILTAVVFLALGVYTRDVNSVLVNAPYFFTGIIAFFIYKFGWKWEYIIVLALIFSVLLKYFQNEDLIAAVLAFSMINWLPKNFKPLRLTGKISYSFYLIHGLFGGWLLYFSSETQLWKNYSGFMILAAILFSWLAALVMYYIIEKPCLKISNRIKYAPVKTKA